MTDEKYKAIHYTPLCSQLLASKKDQAFSLKLPQRVKCHIASDHH